MARKRIKVSSRMLLIWFILAGLIIFLTPSSITNSLQFAFVRIFQLPLSASQSVMLAAQSDQTANQIAEQRKYNKLQNHTANLSTLLEQQKEKVEKLSGLRNRFGLEGARLIISDIITSNVTGPRNELVINRGSNDQLSVNQYILGANNVIGKISEVSPRTARVKLVTDTTSSLPVKINGVDTVLVGKGNGVAGIELLPTKHNVKEGDIVYARKRAGYLDVPMIIGKVIHCEKDDEHPLLWDIEVKPSCDIGRLGDVAVILMNPKQR